MQARIRRRNLRHWKHERKASIKRNHKEFTGACELFGVLLLVVSFACCEAHSFSFPPRGLIGEASELASAIGTCDSGPSWIEERRAEYDFLCSSCSVWGALRSYLTQRNIRHISCWLHSSDLVRDAAKRSRKAAHHVPHFFLARQHDEAPGQHRHHHAAAHEPDVAD